MEQETVLKEILHAFKLHAQHIDEKMDNVKTELESKMDKGFSRVDHKITELGKKVDGIRTELNETNENVDYLLSKNAQHEKKLRRTFEQQQI